jgi:hypothetical protein
MKNQNKHLSIALVWLALLTLNLQLSTVLATPTVTQVAAGWHHTLFSE